jgi:hypothetical protein
MKQILILVMLLGLFACATPKGPLVGADRDEHGCIGSAGYSWDASLQRCVRPWEVNN